MTGLTRREYVVIGFNPVDLFCTIVEQEGRIPCVVVKWDHPLTGICLALVDHHGLFKEVHITPAEALYFATAHGRVKREYCCVSRIPPFGAGRGHS